MDSRLNAERCASSLPEQQPQRLSVCLQNRHGHKPAPKRPSPEEARSIAQNAYVYAFPIVQNYLSIYQLALDPNGSQYKGPPNEVHNVARIFTPADTAHHYS
jgi:hypothetical protein